MERECFIRWREALLLLLGHMFILMVFWRKLGKFAYFFGVGYPSDEWNMLIFSIWMLYHAGYGMILGSGLQKSRTENGYMSLLRYGSFSRYYHKILRKILVTTIIYDGAAFLGIFLGSRMIYANEAFPLMSERLCMAVGEGFFFHWFFGMLMGVCIVKYDRAKEAMLIYPGILFWNLFISNKIPGKVLSILPGNWLHVARSDWYITGGYSMERALIVSAISAIVLYGILHRSK